MIKILCLVCACLLISSAPAVIRENETQDMPGTEIYEYLPAQEDMSGSTKASDLAGLSDWEIIERIGAMAARDMEKSGILASVTTAQFYLESACGHSELALSANNLFGIKAALKSGNEWESVWDGVSVYTRRTGEQKANGSYMTVTASFRAYDSIEQSIEDHSCYLLGAMKDGSLRYEGIAGEKDYRTAFQIIKDGGYASSLRYVDNLCRVVEDWDLTRFDHYPYTADEFVRKYLTARAAE